MAKNFYPILYPQLELQPPRGFPYDDPNESQLGQLMRWCSWLVSPHQGSFLRRYWLGRFGCSIDHYKQYLTVGGLPDTALPMFVAQLEGEFHCLVDPDMLRELSMIDVSADLGPYQSMAWMLRGSLLGYIEMRKAEWEQEQEELSRDDDTAQPTESETTESATPTTKEESE